MLKQQFDSLIEELKNNKNLELEEVKYKPGKPFVKKDAGLDYLIKFIKKEFNEDIPQDFINSVEECNNTHICWRTVFEGKHYWGEFCLKSLVDMYVKFDSPIETYKLKSKHPNLQKLSRIDYHPCIGDVHCVLYERGTGNLYFYYKYCLYELNLSYEAYLQQLTITKGFAPWPFLFVDQDLIEPVEKASLQDFVNMHQHVFGTE